MNASDSDPARPLSESPARPLSESTAQQRLWAVWSLTAAFATYFCMYGFRKPFTAAEFSNTNVGGADFKSVLVTAQVIGYALSKFIGIRVIAELRPARRATTLLLLVGISELALVLFALIPRPWNAVCLFLNGLPLGMVFGLVMGFLEGRRVSEALLAGLCTSFILADGATKSVGAWLLNSGISEEWMPAAAGALFLLPLTLAVSVLSRTPPPTANDVDERSERVQMNRDDRWSMIRAYGPGLAAIILMYLLVTILRSLRADFAAELWVGLGEPAAPQTFTVSEIIVALGVITVNGSLVFVRNNRLAFCLALGICLSGCAMIMLAITGLKAGLGAFGFMVLVGLGLYLPYVAVHATIFERLLAMTRQKGNVGFLMYLADSTGYLGYVGCMIFKGTTDPGGEGEGGGGVLPFFVNACWLTSIVSVVCLLVSMTFFTGRRLSAVAADPDELACSAGHQSL